MSQFIVASRVEGRFGLAIEIIDAADEKAALMARLEVLQHGFAKASGIDPAAFETAQALIEKVEHDHGWKLGVMPLLLLVEGDN